MLRVAGGLDWGDRLVPYPLATDLTPTVAGRPGWISGGRIANARPWLLVALVRRAAAADVVSAARVVPGDRAVLGEGRSAAEHGPHLADGLGGVGDGCNRVVLRRERLRLVGVARALVGMAAGGGLIWLVRVIASAALHREAMGFGDVTLMAMIGAFLGWQPCVIIFFLAPLAGVVVGVLRLVFCRDKEIPYGPFLCLAAAFVVVYWSPVWTWAAPIFALGWLVPAAILCCLVLMGMMLGAWRCVLGLIRCYIRPRQ